jgi:hypothetical protein
MIKLHVRDQRGLLISSGGPFLESRGGSILESVKGIPHIKPHLGGDPLHNQCADRVPQNGIPGFDALVNGKHFDALQIRAGVLWEIKTDNFDSYTATLRRIVIGNQVPELRREREIARACGYDFVVGVRSAAHRTALLAQVPTLNIIVMDWC